MSASDFAGFIAEFDTPEALIAAAKTLRERGYRDLDAYTPYPVHGLDRALGLPRSRLPLVVLAMAILGGSGAYFLQYFLNAVDYPLNVGGRPVHSLPTNLVITFESTVLISAFTCLFGLIAFCGLPRLHHPIFEHEAFLRASVDRFVLGVYATDAKFDEARTREDLVGLGAARTARVGGEP